MRRRFVRTAVFHAVALVLLLGPTTARGADRDEPRSVDAVAVRELLEGANGERSLWTAAPALVVLTSVMDYDGADMASGYTATTEQLTGDELAELTADFTRALVALTGGRLTAFSAVHVEAVPAGQRVKVFRRDQIVVGRFRGVRARTGRLGFGGRTARGGTITAGAVILDRDADRGSDLRQILRTHELGHALGYNHVESRVSVMNPQLGSTVTDSDRVIIQMAFAPLTD